MRLPRGKLLKDSSNIEGMESILVQADKVLKTWQPSWSSFVSAPLKEEVLKTMSLISDLTWHSDGGYPGAERTRLHCTRYFDEAITTTEPAPLTGLNVTGNFLFDAPSPRDIRIALESAGIEPEELGDIWICGDRGAQAICTPEGSAKLDGQTSNFRDVDIFCESVNLSKLQLPTQRVPKKFHSVEASSRLDAIASAGFGLSRAKIIGQIKQGRLRLNWETIKQASKELIVGDRLHLQDRGTVEVLSIQLTKRSRWRIEILRY